MTLSIIVPVFNEERTIGSILKKVLEVKLLGILDKEIIVVDDGSTDNTRAVLSKMKKGLKIISSARNKGKGAAIRAGLKVSTGDIILIQDADLEYDPSYYQSLLDPIIKKKADIVYGSRLINYPLRLWGKNKTILPQNLVANKVLTGLTNLLYGSNISDMETCYKVFKRTCLNSINLESNGFEFEPEITAKFLKKGFNIVEIPIKVNPRTHLEGKKITWRDGFIAIYTLFKYKFYE